MSKIKPSTRAGYDLFLKGSVALSKMEANGIRIDTDYLSNILDKTARDITKREKLLTKHKFFRKWRSRYGDAANYASTDQLRTMLRTIGFKSKEKTPTLKMKVNEEELRRINSPFILDYLELKKQWKTLNTYLSGFKREVDDNGFLHPSFNLASGDDEGGGAESYRGSASMPNFQNIPIRNPIMAALIRPCFIARKGCYLVERDFSGIEVRVAACYTKDRKLIKYVSDPDKGNMHHDMAKRLFSLTDEQVDKKTTRDCAKNMFVFPEFYGSVYFQCAPAIWEAMEKRQFKIAGTDTLVRDWLKEGHGITKLGNCEPGAPTKSGTFVHRVKLVEQFMWEETFTEYTEWKKRWYRQYLSRGWFPLKSGFVCEGYYRRNQVLNFSIQGSAFHCMLWCIIEIQKEIEKRGMKTKLVGQIHDSLLADVPEKEIQEYLDMTTIIMSKRLPKHWPWIIVPIETEVEVVPLGGNWYQKRAWVKDGEWKVAA